MKATGRILEVTNLERFIETYLADPTNPDPTTYSPISEAFIHIGSALPKEFLSFFPSFTVKTKTDLSGAFELDCSNLTTRFPAYLVAYRQLQTVSVGGMTIPIYGPIFRSQSFQLGSMDGNPKNIYVFQTELPNEQGLSQAQVNTQVSQVRNRIRDIDSISASIKENGVRVAGKGKGATVSFRVTLSPSTSFDLDEFVYHKIEDFDIDLPGVDLLTGLCVSEDDIEREVQNCVCSVMAAANKQIKQSMIDGIVKVTGIASSVVADLFNKNVTLTFNKIRYPVVETKKYRLLTLYFRAIVPDPCLGLPRQLYP